MGNSFKNEREIINRLIDNMTLFDDDLMSRVFDRNIEAAELMLRIILGRKIKVISINGQVELKNHEVDGRTIVLDADALDEDGSKINIEVQGNADGAHVRRARYHSSAVDTRMLKAGQKFKELKDSYVIFIYKHDKFGKGLPVYHVERYVTETKERFDDGSHIIYVNGNYKGDDEIGKLIKDFHQTDPDDMEYTALADGVRHFKDTEKGREVMCESVEKYGNERELRGEARGEARGETMGTVNAVKKLMQNMKLNVEQALDVLGIDGDKREEVLKLLNN